MCLPEQERDFTYYSDKQIKCKIEGGETINGIKVNEAGEVVMDDAFTTGLLSKSGLTTFTPIREDENSNLANKYYALVKVIKSKTGTVYELVTNRCGLETVDEGRLKTMLTLIGIGGVQIDDKGKLVIHDGVEVETISEGSTEAKSKEGAA